MILNDIKEGKEIIWVNPNKVRSKELLESFSLKGEDILEAEQRLNRFAPLIHRFFPETRGGIIESPLISLDRFKEDWTKKQGVSFNGKFYAKGDHLLKVAGSVKARGGIYEVLKFAEKVALENNWLEEGDSYVKLGEPMYKKAFKKYRIAVGSTGNLGLSIGIISAALGFRVVVHMSKDAKEWKKALLRKKGVEVKEYESDYGKAVEEGRRASLDDAYTHFVDDENSKDLFLGYSVAALRLQKQLVEEGISVNKDHPLRVYLPCGVGGAPGGIAFGLKIVFGDHVQCYYVEPTMAPCMVLGLVTGKKDAVHVNDYGITLKTEADGLAVGRPSKLVSDFSDLAIDGSYTISDEKMFRLMKVAYLAQNLQIEPSAASSLLGPWIFNKGENITHLSWLTGGSFIPDKEFFKMINTDENV